MRNLEVAFRNHGVAYLGESALIRMTRNAEVAY
jgi:hypothetical protein